MGPMIDDEVTPVFLINGFLEAGKTEFLSFTMEQDYFQTEGKTLLIVCEEGDTEYDDALLKDTKTSVVYADSLDEITPERLTELELLHQPERVLIEWNGMWNQDDLKLPKDWTIYQQITIIDMSTFELYVKNMKSLLNAMVKNSELIICNRCDGIEDLDRYKRMLKSMNTKCDIVFEDENGEIDEISEEDLPYDMKADVIKISPEAYGIWYIDCMDKPERYKGKVVEFTAMVMKSSNFPKNYFVPGRMAMTCCAEDMTFLGYICKSKDARNLETRQWVCVRVLRLNTGRITTVRVRCFTQRKLCRLSRSRMLFSLAKKCFKWNTKKELCGMNLQSSFFVRHIYSMVVPALPLTASSAFAMVVMMALRFLPAFRKERAASIFGSMDEVPNWPSSAYFSASSTLMWESGASSALP